MGGMSEQNESYGAPEDLVVEITAIQPRLYGFILKRLADHEQTLCERLGGMRE